jgi:hypothetical protein
MIGPSNARNNSGHGWTRINTDSENQIRKARRKKQQTGIYRINRICLCEVCLLCGEIESALGHPLLYS